MNLECLFQHLNLLAQGRLRHAKPLGRTAEILLFGDGQEQPEVTDQTEIDHDYSIGLAYLTLL
ncbi:hypothetical protein FQZ97_1207980 [compost metagenome]